MTRDEMFAAIRPFAPQQRFSVEQVVAIDDLADSFGISRLDGGDDWLPYALSLVKPFEGCRLNAYPDPGSGGDPWTIGWGATGKGIARGTIWTQEQADKRLAQDLQLFARGVEGLLGGAATTAQQMGALVSFAYNVGLANLGTSTLLKKHRAGNYAGAAAEFPKWDKAAGRVMAGLTKRRAAEAAVYKGNLS